jgi:hypothetical protein
MGTFATPLGLSFSLRLRFSREQLVRSSYRVTDNALRKNTIGITPIGILSFLSLHRGVLAFHEC